LIQNQADLDMFDFGTGLGFDCWKGFAFCDGIERISPLTKKKITPPNFIDRFIVQAGGIYVTDDTGGLDSVTLTVQELPAHNHNITDTGHSHAITDPGHDHGTTEAPHTHTVTLGAHTHDLQINAAGDHEHSTGYTLISDGGGGSTGVRTTDAVSGNATTTNGLHSHSGTALPSANSTGSLTPEIAGINIDEAFTGISVSNNQSGVTVNNTGDNEAHENRPPYYAAIYVMKLW
jgi:microcystin-dependent protein